MGNSPSQSEFHLPPKLPTVGREETVNSVNMHLQQRPQQSSQSHSASDNMHTTSANPSHINTVIAFFKTKCPDKDNDSNNMTSCSLSSDEINTPTQSPSLQFQLQNSALIQSGYEIRDDQDVLCHYDSLEHSQLIANSDLGATSTTDTKLLGDNNGVMIDNDDTVAINGFQVIPQQITETASIAALSRESGTSPSSSGFISDLDSSSIQTVNLVSEAANTFTFPTITQSSLQNEKQALCSAPIRKILHPTPESEETLLASLSVLPDKTEEDTHEQKYKPQSDSDSCKFKDISVIQMSTENREAPIQEIESSPPAPTLQIDQPNVIDINNKDRINNAKSDCSALEQVHTMVEIASPLADPVERVTQTVPLKGLVTTLTQVRNGDDGSANIFTQICLNDDSEPEDPNTGQVFTSDYSDETVASTTTSTPKKLLDESTPQGFQQSAEAQSPANIQAPSRHHQVVSNSVDVNLDNEVNADSSDPEMKRADNPVIFVDPPTPSTMPKLENSTKATLGHRVLRTSSTIARTPFPQSQSQTPASNRINSPVAASTPLDKSSSVFGFTFTTAPAPRRKDSLNASLNFELACKQLEDLKICENSTIIVSPRALVDDMPPSLSDITTEMNGESNHNEFEETMRVEDQVEETLRVSDKSNVPEQANSFEPVKNKTETDTNYKKILAEYEKTLSVYIQEVSDLKQKLGKSNEEKLVLIKDRDQALEDLSNAESAFSDVHRKYERTKGILGNLKENENQLIRRDEDLIKKVSTRDKKLELYKEEAQEKLEQMYQDYEAKVKEMESESTKLRAQCRLLEMKLQPLQNDVKQKADEISKLRALCDELINGQQAP